MKKLLMIDREAGSNPGPLQALLHFLPGHDDQVRDGIDEEAVHGSQLMIDREAGSHPGTIQALLHLRPVHDDQVADGIDDKVVNGCWLLLIVVG